MNIAKMEKFEQLWGLRHDLPAESLAQYRFESREGYRLPELAAHYRTHCEALDSIILELPLMTNNGFDGFYPAYGVKRAIEAAGLKVAE